MRPRQTQAVAIVVGAVAVLGSVRLPAAQNASADPLAVRMPDAAAGVYVESVVSIAIRLGVPVGFEEAGALNDRVRGPFLPLFRGKPIVGVRQRPLDLRGMTLREALGTVTADDRRYEWRDIDGVLVVRPVSSWGDPSHPLIRTMRDVRAGNKSLADAVDSGRVDAGSDQAGLTLFDRLNATLRARPGFHWILAPSTSRVQLDRGRVVEVVSPELRLGDGTGEARFSVIWP